METIIKISTPRFLSEDSDHPWLYQCHSLPCL